MGADRAYITAKQNRDRICNAQVDFLPRNLKSITGNLAISSRVPQSSEEMRQSEEKCLEDEE